MTLERVHRTALRLVIALSLSYGVGVLMYEQLDDSTEESVVLPNRINPNDATIGSLIRLTGIGPARARSIVAFREAFQARHPDDISYKTLQDLEQVKGIGPATIDGISAWLALAPVPADP